MIRFLKNSLILSAPFVFWVIFVVVIDPFNYFGFSNAISGEVKEQNSGRLNTLLYRTISFKRYPTANILIGDSRTDLLPVSELERITGKHFGKLTNNAAKLNEIFELFYFANSYHKLETVVIGINFNMFNEYGYADRVKDIKEIISFPPRYVFSTSVAEACYFVLRAQIIGKDISDVPPMTREEFWKWNIEEKATHWYGKYKYPNELYAQMRKLDDFAIRNDINLIFIVVPHHREFHDRLIEFGLLNEELKFKEYLSSLNAKVIDYDFENEITIDKENFTDPVHYQESIGRLMVNEIWGNKILIGKPLN